MARSPSLKPGERLLAPPAGTLPRTGGQLSLPMDQAKARANPVAPSPESVANGKRLFGIYCAACHGAEGKGDGPVAKKFIPPPDLSLPLIQKETDGFLDRYVSHGGAVMPSYGESLSARERWDVINYIRTFGKK